MKRIAVNIHNRVFSDSIMMMLRRTGDFRPVAVSEQAPDRTVIECAAALPEILLMDVAPSPPETALDSRLELADALSRERPECKIALLCDETAHPELAREVMRAKQAGQIDAFFYASVSAEYLMAALDAL